MNNPDTARDATWQPLEDHLSRQRVIGLRAHHQPEARGFGLLRAAAVARLATRTP